MSKQLVTIGVISILFHLNTFSQSAVEKGLQTINKNSLQSQLAFFSSDWFEGREASSKGAYMAADYLASLFQQEGLLPAGEDSTFFQKVPLIIYEKSESGHIILKKKNRSNSFKPHHDYLPPLVGPTSEIEAPAFWGGFGFNSPTFKEFSAKDATGKIMVRLKGLPARQPHSAYFSDLKEKSEQLLNTIKYDMAKEAGVIAIIEYDLNDPFLTTNAHPSPTHAAQASTEKKLTKRSSGIYQKYFQLPYTVHAKIPIYKVSQTIMQSLIPDFDSQLKQYLTNIEKAKPQSLPLTAETIQLSVTSKSTFKTCRNVIARIEGSEFPDEIIVIGAHYDHLGTYDGYIWNGADDNGSGAIGVAAIAKAFMATGMQPKRTVIFATWTAEERGLLGSQYFVDQFADIDKVKYYHNYDMIGRSYDPAKPDSAVSLLYTESWKAAEQLSGKFNTDYHLGLKINFSPWDNPVGGSDNAHFAKKGIPIMWFHTGGHPDYHMPGDHVNKIDWSKLEGIVKTSFLTLWVLANE